MITLLFKALYFLSTALPLQLQQGKGAATQEASTHSKPEQAEAKPAITPTVVEGAPQPCKAVRGKEAGKSAPQAMRAPGGDEEALQAVRNAKDLQNQEISSGPGSEPWPKKLCALLGTGSLAYLRSA